MTAPDMVSIIAKVIADNSVVIHEHADYGEMTASTLAPDAMARAVLAAISEAGHGNQYAAWEAGHNHCFHVENPRNKERNPYPKGQP